MKPLISVVCISYNLENYISETINSILSQTYDNFELLIIDDHSVDNTAEVIKTFDDKRIRFFINEKNEGAAYSRNRGFNEAKGEYVAFIDGDDIWHKEKLEKQLRFMTDNGYLFSCTAYQNIDENGFVLNRVSIAPKKMDHRVFLRTNYVGCSTVMLSKNVYDGQAVKSSIKKRNDYALWIVASEKTDCYFLNEILCYYRRRNNSLSSSSKIKLFRFHQTMWKQLYGYSSFKSWCYSLRNAFFYFYRDLFFKKKVKNK